MAEPVVIDFKVYNPLKAKFVVVLSLGWANNLGYYRANGLGFYNGLQLEGALNLSPCTLR